MKGRILIVEDNATESKVVELMVKPFADCATARDGHEALHLFVQAIERKAAFDAVILDIGMPIMDGLSALRQIRDYERECGVRMLTPAIMLTGQNDTCQVSEARSLGVEHYLLKPIGEMELVGALQKLGMVTSPGGWCPSSSAAPRLSQN